MGERLKVAIAGLDSFFFSRMFAAQLQANSGVQLVGCAALGASREAIRGNAGLEPEALAAEFGGVPLFGDDVEAMVAATGAEAVCVATRPTAMPALATRLAALGVHAYFAKPIAVSEEGLAALESLAPGGAAVWSAGPTARFDAPLREAREKIARGDIGEVAAIRVMHQHGMLKFWPQISWYYEAGEGGEGGIEFFLAWYCIDLLHWLTGRRVRSIQGAAAANLTDRGSPHADVLKAVCTLEGGALGSFDVLFNVAWPYPSFEAEIIGTEGAIRVSQDAFEGRTYGAQGVSAFGKRTEDTLYAELADWVEACRGEKAPAVPWEDALAIVRTSLELRRALARG